MHGMSRGGLFFGVDYYPEHWPRSRWPLDAELMRDAGFNVVRLAEFAWCRLEPSPGVFDFSWLDEAIGLLYEKGIRVVLGTPTAAPPPWLVKLHPDILPVDYKGHAMPPTARRHYCPNNPNYREATRRVVSAIANHYKNDERVVGYQVDNELSLDEEYCYCGFCLDRFREWLRSRYGDVGTLNRVYGTIFWSQEYGDWSEVYPPTPPFDMRNRSLALDWFRFRSEYMVDFLKLQVEILRAANPEKMVTTNLPGALHASVDSYRMGENLDFASWDCYPRFANEGYDPAWSSLQHDSARCMSRDRRFWVMELQAGPTDGYLNAAIGVTPEPGELRKWAYQAIAHGAEGVVYFRWRTACFGKEQYWHGILNHDGEVNRRFMEVKRLGEELKAIEGALNGTSFHSTVAVIFSYETLWSTLIERGYYQADYYTQVFTAYRGLWAHGINIDVVPPSADLSRYKVVMAPHLYLTGSEVARRLEEYVRNGGVLIASARTSVKNEHNNVYSDGLPGGLTALFGMRVLDYTRLPSTARASIEVRGLPLQAHGWLEELGPSTADVIGVHSYSWLRGKPAITVNSYGRGLAIYVGSFLTPELSSYISRLLIDMGVITPPATLASGEAELALRSGDGYDLLFIINHGAEERGVQVTLREPRDAKGLLTGVEYRGRTVQVSLKPHDVEIFKLF